MLESTCKMDCNAEKHLVIIGARRAIYNCAMKEHSNQPIVDKLWNAVTR
jgi:hypothetical protein